jgi:DNA-binding transcriptional ArsR family regulator
MRPDPPDARGAVSVFAGASRLTGRAGSRTEPTGYLTERFSMPTDALSATFSALADPTRRAILARLALGETSVTELAEPFAMSMPAVSKHLKVLERAGLIARGREAQWRPCRIEAQALKPVDDWLENYRRLWEQRFDRLEDYLRELQAQEKPKGARKSKKEKSRGRKK